MKERHFGPIPTIGVGYEFANRAELSQSLVHRPLQAKYVAAPQFLRYHRKHWLGNE